MAQFKNAPYSVTFEMNDTSGVAQAGKTVTATVSKDGAAYAAATGTVTEIGSGDYIFNGLAADFNCDTYMLKFAASGCRDTKVAGNTESTYTAQRAGYIDRVNTALPNIAAGANGGLPTGDASGRVTVGSLATDSITAAAIKADAVTEIQNGLATGAAQTDAQTSLDNIEGAQTTVQDALDFLVARNGNWTKNDPDAFPGEGTVTYTEAEEPIVFDVVYDANKNPLSVTRAE